MFIPYAILASSVFVLIVLLFVVFNTLLKIEKYEDAVTEYESLLQNISEDIDYIIKRLNEVDHRGAFKSDDEIGWFWSEVTKLKDILENYREKDELR